MNTIYALTVLAGILIIGLLLFYIALFCAEKLMHKKISVASIFKDFKQKMWMTIGLGIVFFGLYVLIVYIGSYIATNFNLFKLIHKNPVTFIYLGLLTFALVTTCIYLTRLIIKFLYNSKRRY